MNNFAFIQYLCTCTHRSIYDRIIQLIEIICTRLREGNTVGIENIAVHIPVIGYRAGKLVGCFL